MTYADFTKASIDGDSGGALYILDEGQYKLVGIHSGGIHNTNTCVFPPFDLIVDKGFKPLN